MPAKRVSMRRVQQILQLKYEAGASDRAIGLAVGVARSTARLCLDPAVPIAAAPDGKDGRSDFGCGGKAVAPLHDEFQRE
jgi:hypothetical protein